MEIHEFDAWIESASGNFYHIQIFATSMEEAEKEAKRYLSDGEAILGIEEIA